MHNVILSFAGTLTCLYDDRQARIQPIKITNT